MSASDENMIISVNGEEWVRDLFVVIFEKALDYVVSWQYRSGRELAGRKREIRRARVKEGKASADD